MPKCDCIHAQESFYYKHPICLNDKYGGKLCFNHVTPCPEFKDTLDEILRRQGEKVD